MKKYSFLEAIGSVDEKYLEEAISDKECGKRHISMGKKRLVRILIAAVLVLSIGVTTVVSANYTKFFDREGVYDPIAGITEEEFIDDALTVILCGPATYDIEIAAEEFKRIYKTDVNIIKYNNDNDWDKFYTKVMSQSSDFDLFMPVYAQTADMIRSGIYQELSGYEGIKSRIGSNQFISMISVMDGGLIGVPCNVQLIHSKDDETAMTLFKYCYKNINTFAGRYSDPEGEELFRLLKNRYLNPSDSRENAFYDFEYNEALTEYLFMNKFSENKDLAADFLCVLFDVLNKDIDGAAHLTYPSVEADTEYLPDWLFYSYNYVEPIGGAFFAAADTDGSDEALYKLAREAAEEVRSRIKK